MRASSSLRLAALSLAVAFAGGSLASAQCPNCGPGEFGYGYGHHNYRIGDYGHYGGDAGGYGGGLHSGGVGPGDCVYRHYPTGDLFRQYYIGNNCGGAPAAMYPAPNTTIPPFVGHVYYTYEPFYPHEMLYPHHRTYHRYYNDGRGLTRTHVSWKASHTLSALRVIPFSVIP